MSDLMAQSSSFSGDSGSHERLYDVFLSFRGEDTGKNFVDHVYTAFEKEGFLIFRDDDETQRGEDIKSELVKIICQSRCSIVVISEGYASSGRCLDKLEVILECERQLDQFFFPVFYGVDPSHVRERTGSVATAFARHRKSQSLIKMDRWWEALRSAAFKPEMVVQNEADWKAGTFIPRLVAVTKSRIQQSRSGRTIPYLVGIDSRVKDINSWLQDENSDIGVFVIHGMKGIGKTTIARYAYILNVARFDRSCFLENISEISLIDIKQKLNLAMYAINDDIYRKIDDISGIGDDIWYDRIRNPRKSKRVLVVLDGLEDMKKFDTVMEQLKDTLCRSTIIITTTNARMSKAALSFGCKVCSVGILNDNESLELFCWQAFQQSHPIEGYMEHSNSIVKYCGGLPLALTILGSSLSGQSIVAWESTLKELETIPHPSIMRKLKRSYYSVNDSDRALFLCIACCFIGWNIDDFATIFKRGDPSFGMEGDTSFGMESGTSFGMEGDTSFGMESLIENCLLTIDSDNKVNMHPMIRDMGREIVRREPRERANCRRLLRDADVFQALTEKNINPLLETAAMNDLMAQISSFSGESGSQYLYDVFLSFGGEDTGKTFVDHLCAALEKEGLSTFRDGDELVRGGEIEQGVRMSIEKSRCSIVVFSKGYASSRWCLDQLVMILEWKKTSDQYFVVPIFYGVAPSDVRKQTGSVAEAFARHKESERLGKVNLWRAALRDAADLAGMIVQSEADGHGSKFMEALVAMTKERLGDHLFRIDSRAKGINSWLQDEYSDSGMLHEKNGIGKTTIADVGDHHFGIHSRAEGINSGLQDEYSDSGMLHEKSGIGDTTIADVEDKGLTEPLKSLFLHCSLFPLDYEFKKYELVQLWIAEGFIGERHGVTMEDTGNLYFNSMESEGFFVLSRSDFSVDFDSVFSLPIYNPSNFFYKINTIKLSVLGNRIYEDGYFRAVDGKLDGASERAKHLSVSFENMDEMDCGVLQKFKDLRTLLLFYGSRSSIKQVPRNLLSGLKFLWTLNLSGTLISELPSSIRYVKELRYLDVSHTPIRQLPEAIDSLDNLQTIKLRGCVNFVQLPTGIKKLTNLRHIELDIIRQLDSLPAYLGKLTNLQTLSAFLVGRDQGCDIGELKNLNHLKGALRISRLENVLTKEEAEKASLSTKKFLQRVVLRWSSLLVENVREKEILQKEILQKEILQKEILQKGILQKEILQKGILQKEILQKEILQCLQPHYGLQELGIQNYSGSTLPAWISNRAFADLLVVTLYRCKNCKRLPSLGQLPALKFLSIIEMNEVKEIHHHLFRNDGVAQEDPAFPKLERLEIDIMLNLKEWTAIIQGDLPSLLKLTVDSCPELVTLPSLSELKSLKHLEFRRCPMLLPLPQDGLPTSLECLVIIRCPQLKEWCTKRGGQDQDTVSHVPRVWLDHEEL